MYVFNDMRTVSLQLEKLVSSGGPIEDGKDCTLKVEPKWNPSVPHLSPSVTTSPLDLTWL